MNPEQPQSIELSASDTTEFEALAAAERPAHESEPAHGVPSWDPDDGDFS
jgi:hypothetical protein